MVVTRHLLSSLRSRLHPWPLNVVPSPECCFWTTTPGQLTLLPLNSLQVLSSVMEVLSIENIYLVLMLGIKIYICWPRVMELCLFLNIKEGIFKLLNHLGLGGAIFHIPVPKIRLECYSFNIPSIASSNNIVPIACKTLSGTEPSVAVDSLGAAPDIGHVEPFVPMCSSSPKPSSNQLDTQNTKPHDSFTSSGSEVGACSQGQLLGEHEEHHDTSDCDSGYNSPVPSVFLSISHHTDLGMSPEPRLHHEFQPSICSPWQTDASNPTAKVECPTLSGATVELESQGTQTTSFDLPIHRLLMKDASTSTDTICSINPNINSDPLLPSHAMMPENPPYPNPRCHESAQYQDRHVGEHELQYDAWTYIQPTLSTRAYHVEHPSTDVHPSAPPTALHENFIPPPSPAPQYHEEHHPMAQNTLSIPCCLPPVLGDGAACLPSEADPVVPGNDILEPMIQDLLEGRLHEQHFDGDIDTYLTWKTTINHFISLSQCPAIFAIDVLYANTSGRPHEIISGIRCGLSSPDERLEEVWSSLDHEYDHPFTVAQFLLDRLYSTPEIPDRDFLDPDYEESLEQMQNLAWQCKCINDRMATCPELKMLDTYWGISLISSKMPARFQEDWKNYFVEKLVEDDRHFLSYRRFFKFLKHYVQFESLLPNLPGFSTPPADEASSTAENPVSGKHGRHKRRRKGRKKKGYAGDEPPALMSLHIPKLISF